MLFLETFPSQQLLINSLPRVSKKVNNPTLPASLTTRVRIMIAKPNVISPVVATTVANLMVLFIPMTTSLVRSESGAMGNIHQTSNLSSHPTASQVSQATLGESHQRTKESPTWNCQGFAFCVSEIIKRLVLSSSNFYNSNVFPSAFFHVFSVQSLTAKVVRMGMPGLFSPEMFLI